MGQGTYTGLATLVAEELDADWAQIRVEGAPADAKRYNNLFWGPAQGTGGSTAIANSFEQLRKAGATARAMLVAAAARRWNVPAAEIDVAKRRRVAHKSGKRARFGELAADAAKLPVPAEVKLKDPKDFVLHRQARAAHRRAGEVDRARRFHAGREAARACSPRWSRTRRASARKVKSFDAAKAQAVQGRRGCRRVRRSRHAASRCSRRLLVGEEGARRADRRVGRDRRLQARLGGDHGRVPQARRHSRARSRARTATPPRRSPARRRRSKRPTSSRTSRTRRWSR